MYERFNIYMTLSKGKIDGFGIFEPSLGIPVYGDIRHDFTDFHRLEFGDKKLTIKGFPNFEDDEGKNKNSKLLLEIINTSSDGDEVVWTEYIALKEKQDEAKEEAWAGMLAKTKKQKQAELAKAKKQKQADNDTFNTNWSKIKMGLATYQVENLVGKPIGKEGSTRNYGGLYWYYSGNRREGAHVYFKKNYNIRHVSPSRM